MQRLNQLINHRNRQTGGMTIFTAVLVLIVLTLMIFYAARVGLFEQAVSANDVRQKLAFHAAGFGGPPTTSTRHMRQLPAIDRRSW